MARISVKAGADLDLDLLDRDAVRQSVDSALSQYARPYSTTIDVLTVINSSVAGGAALLAGNPFSNVEIWTVPSGMTAFVNRLAVVDGVHNPGAPLVVGAGVWMTFHVDEFATGRVVYNVPNSPGGWVLPFQVTDGGEDQAKRLRSNQKLCVSGQLTGLAAQGVTVTAQVRLVQGLTTGKDQ